MVRVGVLFNVNYEFLGFLQVIWVIGVSMILTGCIDPFTASRRSGLWNRNDCSSQLAGSL